MVCAASKSATIQNDFGTSTGEAFVSELSETWTFADATKLTGSINQFLVWYNPDAVPVNVDITFILSDGTTRTTDVTTDRFRRGGINLNEMGSIPNDSSFSIKVEADREIVVALTGYDVPRLYALKGEVVRRGVRAVTGFDMPIFPKRRFQHGALPAERLRSRLGGDEDRYRRRFFALQA